MVFYRPFVLSCHNVTSQPCKICTKINSPESWVKKFLKKSTLQSYWAEKIHVFISLDHEVSNEFFSDGDKLKYGVAWIFSEFINFVLLLLFIFHLHIENESLFIFMYFMFYLGYGCKTLHAYLASFCDPAEDLTEKMINVPITLHLWRIFSVFLWS